tara:strand:- start:28660 stop:29823 length:1164 start_codon:yes stop_codon:yes gene_type:complete
MNARTNLHQPARVAPTTRSAFTLVEMLVVISIIGILAAILLPAVTSVLRTGRTAGLKAEVQSLSEGVERYQTKFGDYPPDFMKWNIAERHYRKIFPDIAASELTLLRAMCLNSAGTAHDPTAMDRAEALVWALGGFSSDPQFPFTGVGGPLALIPGATDSTNPLQYHYNIDRQNGMVDLDLMKLTLRKLDDSAPISTTNRITTTDDTAGVDAFPVYRAQEDSAPYVYFDSRTYNAIDVMGDPSTMNGFGTDVGGEADLVRPVMSDSVNPNPQMSGTTFGSYSNAATAFLFMNERTFQVLSPGLDGRYGMVASGGPGTGDNFPAYWQYPSGQLVYAVPGASSAANLKDTRVQRYNITSAYSGVTLDSFEKDNLASFSQSTFDNDLPSQ